MYNLDLRYNLEIITLVSEMNNLFVPCYLTTLIIKEIYFK